MLNIKFFITTLLLSFQALIAQPTEKDLLKAAKNPDYFVHVVLTGVVKRMIFPGPPNFHSVKEGDWAEPRTILEIDNESLLRLVKTQAKVTLDQYMGKFIDSELTEDEPNAKLVTLDGSFTEEPDNIEIYENKIVTIDAVLSAQPAHGHTPFVVEIVEVLTHE